ncbi:D-glycero-alpha-D-manno-heptose-1,7-bisphosphate 7-phosphatase [Commensalibacter oyaizuii]|uniref:D,D-heptose 1,7-bisphosphate phosphatase n=1 Tax=Commensalibacter oyaizuii TaxID=3043873 RepID=A0ABT6Q2T0_9PROT|nr:HAD family hydrolase [Commensalibacter sp. TBRC 16381]MDI2091446.1 HAD family hydrolase [Commensalibacter sp. TBRC 16381]
MISYPHPHRYCLFLDRDGVINVDTRYPYRKDELQLIDGVGKAIAKMNSLGYLVIVVTNQSGIARGFFSEQDMHQFHHHINILLRKENAFINAFYFCPYHPDGIVPIYKQEHINRKPNPGMIEQAIKDYSIDRRKSFLIGDKMTDIQAAHNAHIDGYLFAGGNLDIFLTSILKKRFKDSK